LRFLPLLFTCALAAATAAAQQTETAVASAQDEPSGELTLEQVLALATSRSPEIAAAQIEVRAREGRLLQAGARPNPELSGTTENLGGDVAKTGGVQSTLQIGQRLELGGDRAARIAAAAAGRDLGRWDLESRRLDILGRATRAFADVLSAQRRVELADDTVRVAEEVRSTVAARVEAGKVSPIEETRAEVALATERIERNRAATELAAARSRLAATWGGTSARFTGVTGDLDALPVVPPLDVVVVRVERNPEVARWTAEIAEREAMLRVERSRAVPDVTLGGGYRHFELGSSAAVVTASIPLPMFDRNRGAQIEARERLARAQEERRSAIVRLRQLAQESHSALVRAQAEVRDLREQVVPGAESVYGAVSEGYRLGKFGYMEVLDARRTLATVRAQLAAAQAELHRAYADLQRLTAAPANDMTNGEQQ
jgi:cobalt-zinc-cadmium efflux system outer membrane protein